MFSWLQRAFGFGRGGVMGCGCGMVIFVIAACVILGQICNIDWLRLFNGGALFGGG